MAYIKALLFLACVAAASAGLVALGGDDGSYWPGKYDVRELSPVLGQLPSVAAVRSIAAPGLIAPGIAAPGLVAPAIAARGLVAPGLVSHGIAAPGLLASGLVAPGIAARGIAGIW